MLMWGCSIYAQEPVVESKERMSPSVHDWFKNRELAGNLQFQGFVSQAYIATTDNDVFGNTDSGGSFGFTEAGLNALMRPMPRLQLSAQVLSRRAGHGNSATPRLDFGFADYRLYSHETNQLGVRLGRLKIRLVFITTHVMLRLHAQAYYCLNPFILIAHAILLFLRMPYTFTQTRPMLILEVLPSNLGWQGQLLVIKTLRHQCLLEKVT